MKFKEYPNATTLADSDALIVDADGGTKYILTKDAAVALVGSISPEAHSRIFRGKNLGTSVTAAQKAAIQDGTFKDLFLGDYWVINDVTWRIVDMDYWYNTDSPALTTHHLVIMPDTTLYTHAMNDTPTTTGGYVGSKMYTTGLTQAKTTIAAAFPDMVLTHREYLSNAVTNGVVTGMALKKSTVELPSEIMIYGANIFSAYAVSANLSDGSYSGFAIGKTQLALFDVAPKFINSGQKNYWLRDVVSDSYFADVADYGAAGYEYAVFDSPGVRPVFSIG